LDKEENVKSSVLDYLNLGCGEKYHPDWVNLDLYSGSPHVMEHDLTRGIPFPDGSFSVVYHSQVLEHLPAQDAPSFIAECYRVLRPGGILRVVVPDLENIVREYLKWLEICLRENDPAAAEKYDWAMLEMLDQSVRTQSGGGMAPFLQREVLQAEDHILNRTGYVGRMIRARAMQPGNGQSRNASPARRLYRYGKRLIGRVLHSDFHRLGRFRSSGEIHHWMYDRFSLARLLQGAGFSEVRVMDPYTSGIPSWESYALDVKDGRPYDPASLFMEARK